MNAPNAPQPQSRLTSLSLLLVLAGCAAEGALANAMVVEGDAEGALIKLSEDGLPVCSDANDGVVYYLDDSDQLAFCAGGSYRTLGDGLCTGPQPDASAATGEAGPGAAAGEGGVLEAGLSDAHVEGDRQIPCVLSVRADGVRSLRCDDGTNLELSAEAWEAGAQASEADGSR